MRDGDAEYDRSINWGRQSLSASESPAARQWPVCNTKSDHHATTTQSRPGFHAGLEEPSAAAVPSLRCSVAGAAGQAQPPRPAQPKSAASSAFSALTSRDLGAPSPRHRSKKGEQENTEKQGNGETAKQVLTSESANSRLRKTRLGLGSVAVQITVPCLNTHTETHTRQFEVAVPGTDSMGRGERESLFCPGSSGGVVGPSRDT